jgi:hypothetical protein
MSGDVSSEFTLVSFIHVSVMDEIILTPREKQLEKYKDLPRKSEGIDIKRMQLSVLRLLIGTTGLSDKISLICHWGPGPIMLIPIMNLVSMCL